MGRNGWTLLERIMRRKTDEEDIYYLKTQKGIGLKVTGKHKIPIIRNNKEQEITQFKWISFIYNLRDGRLKESA